MKICPNCGSHLKGNEIFCPNCGYDLSRSRSQNDRGTDDQQASNSDDQIGLNSYFQHLERSVASDRTDQTAPHANDQSFRRNGSSINNDQPASFSDNQNEQAPLSSASRPNYTAQEPGYSSTKITNYFRWWWQTVRHPAEQLTGSWYFGLISFVIDCFLWVLSFHGLIGRFNALINSFFGEQISVDNAMFENADQSWWGLIVIGVLAGLSYWLLGYGFRKFHREIGFWQYSNQLAALTNLAMPLSLVMLVLTELGSVPLAMICFLAVMVIDVVGLSVSIVADRSQLYLAMLAVGLVPLIVVIVFTCIIQIIG